MEITTNTRTYTARRLSRNCRTQANLPTLGKPRQGSSDVRINLQQIASPVKLDGIKKITSPKSNKSLADKSTKSSTKNSTNDSNKSTAPYSYTSSNKTVSSFGTEAGFHEATQCFLKTKTNKFKRFTIEVQDGQLNFYKYRGSDGSQKSSQKDGNESQADDKRASHSLEHVHVMFGAIERDSQSQQYFYPVRLSFSNSFCRRQLYFKSPENQKQWLNKLLKVQGFNDQTHQYRFNAKDLRTSPVCTVKVARHKSSGMAVAMKIINKRNLKESKQSQYYHEASVLAPCKHPNIVKFVESFDTPEQVYIATEYQSGGDLIHYINKHWQGNYLPESAVKPLALGIAQGLLYLHKNKIVHRDIKPENIVLVEDKKVGPVAQIVDFGFARRLESGETCTGVVGTIPYIAPEVLTRQPYTYSSDLWSYGCMIYGLLSGDHPLLTSCRASFDDMRKIIIERKVRMDQPVWKKLSPECLDFVQNLLLKDPKDRLDIVQVVNHPWLQEARC